MHILKCKLIGIGGVSGVKCDRKDSSRSKREGLQDGSDLETEALSKRQEAELKMLRFSLGVTRKISIFERQHR